MNQTYDYLKIISMLESIVDILIIKKNENLHHLDIKPENILITNLE